MSIILYSQLTSLSNIYDYSFIEIEDKFIFTIYSIGVGFNVNDFEIMTVGDTKYIIYLIERELILNKSTGEFEWRTDNYENRNKILKRIPFTIEETSQFF